MKVNDKLKMPCGHQGTIVYLNDRYVAVKGLKSNNCEGCSQWREQGFKKPKNNRVSTTLILALEET